MTASVITRSYDFYRTGANDREVTLSASAVRSRGIAKLFSMAIPDDPRLEAQPLAVGNVRLSNGQMHDVVFQASMGNTVYAFDAATGGELWKTNLGRPIVGTRQIDAWLVNVDPSCRRRKSISDHIGREKIGSCRLSAITPHAVIMPPSASASNLNP